MPREDGESAAPADKRAIFKWLIKTYLPLWMIASAIIFTAVYVAAWVMLGKNEYNRPRQFVTYRVISDLSHFIPEYQKTNNQLPDDLRDPYFDQKVTNFDAQRGVIDGWDRPIRYEVNSGKFIVYSPGRDGMPGGDGLDADIDSDSPRLEAPTFWQFLTTTDKQEIAGSNVFMWAGASCFLSLAFLFAAFTKVRESYTLAGRLRMLGIALLCSGVVAFFLIRMQLLRGH